MPALQPTLRQLSQYTIQLRFFAGAESAQAEIENILAAYYLLPVHLCVKIKIYLHLL